MAYNAKNKTTSARELLIERSKFDSYIIGEIEGSLGSWQNKKIKDFINTEKIFFGRVDHENESVTPKPEKLKIFSGNDKVSALNFVADAFFALEKRFQNAVRKGQVKGNLPVYSSFSAKRGYSSPILNYEAYMNHIVVDGFISFMSPKSRRENVRNFKTFFPLYREFLLRKSSFGVPITKSFFMKSAITPPLSSGLMVEIFVGDCSDDSLKYELFYGRRDFAFLKNLAYQHGFVIDKHVPWRLVADISSVNMEPYLVKHFYSSSMDYEVFFSSFYDKVNKDDFDDMIKLATSAYNTFVSRFPVYKPPACTASNFIIRKPISLEEAYESKVSIEQWLELYVRTRSLESKIGYDNPSIDRIVDNAVDLTNSLDISRGMGYINSKFNNVEHFGGSLFYDKTKRKMSENTDDDGSSLAESVKRSVQASNFKTY